MSEETQVVRPLTSDEVKDAIAQTIAEKVRESLNTTCWLYGMSWPKFKVDPSRLNIVVANMYDQEQEASVMVAIPTHEIGEDGVPVLVGGDIRDGQAIAVSVEIPYTPPNVLRKQHGMAIPTVVKRDDGSTKQKAVMFKRKPGRPKANADID
jgi:hypothetical protein